MAAPSVLDVGCGTGAMLHEARQLGHVGRLCGLDPARYSTPPRGLPVRAKDYWPFAEVPRALIRF